MTEHERLAINDGDCPDCGERGFVIGPRGGMAINIECANLDCRARFNVALYSGRAQMVERLPKVSEGGLPWPSEPKKKRR